LKWLALTLTCLCALILLTPSAKADTYTGTANLSFPSGSTFQFHDITMNVYIIHTISSGWLNGTATWQETDTEGYITITPATTGVLIITPTQCFPLLPYQSVFIYINDAQYDGNVFAYTATEAFTVRWVQSVIGAPFHLAAWIPFSVKMASLLLPLFAMAYMYTRIRAAPDPTRRIREGILTLIIALMSVIVFFSLWYLSVALDAMI
jgi:hypothetical protein